MQAYLIFLQKLLFLAIKFFIETYISYQQILQQYFNFINKNISGKIIRLQSLQFEISSKYNYDTLQNLSLVNNNYLCKLFEIIQQKNQIDLSPYNLSHNKSLYQSNDLNKRILASCVDGCFCILKNCSSCKSGYKTSRNGLQVSCYKCDVSCKDCSGPSSSECTSCESGIELTSSKQCKVCDTSIGEFYNSSSKKCEKCSQNCQTCSSSTVCQQCLTGYKLNKNKQCESCNGICDNTCKVDDGYFLNENDNCLLCHPTCKTCSGGSSNECIQCKSNLFKSENGECTDCNQPGHFIKDSNCQTCDSSCQKCNGSSQYNCIECAIGQYLHTDTNECKSNCDQSQGLFLNNTNCIPCDTSCKTCSGSKNTECVECAIDHYKYGNDNLCKPCSASYQKNDLSKCLQVEKKCELNIQNQQYELKEVCIQCQPGLAFSTKENACISCSQIQPSFEFDPIKQQCACPSQKPYQHQAKDNKVTCYNTQQKGFYCDKNNICTECIQNCSNCSDKITCNICNDKFYLWQKQCIQECQESIGLEISKLQKECQCKNGYQYRQQEKLCVDELKINSLSLSKNSQYNVISVILNRIPYQDEAYNIKLLIDPSKLKLEQDYKIVSQYNQGNQQIFNVFVNQNRKINEIQIIYNNKTTKLQVNNALLTTVKYNENQQQMSENMNSISSASQFLTPKDGISSNIILFLKNLQVLCMLSNFVQLLGPLIVFKDSVPQPLYIGSVFGASFIFNSVPDAQQISTLQQDHQILSSDENTQQDFQQIKTDNLKKQLLEQLGLQPNIYNGMLIPHLSLIISVFTILLCLFARWVFKGKQYTLNIVNALINTMSSLHQGYITPTLFSIYYSLIYSSQKELAILQLIIHLTFLVLIIFIIMKNDEQYINKNTPNFILNLNVKTKGWRSYLIMSFAKKYLCIFIILFLSNKAKTACIIIAIIFISFSIYLLYYRFFTHCFFSFYKVLQELVIGVTMILFYICISKQENILEKDIIDDQELYDINSFSMIVLVMIAICLMLSFLLFIIRNAVQLYLLFQQIRKYFQNKKNKNNLLLNKQEFDSLQTVIQTMKSRFTQLTPKKNISQYQEEDVES